MRYVMASIFDRAVGAYMRPMFLRSEGEAIRVFTDEVNRVAADNPMRAHPEHFSLFFIGHYFDDNGSMVAPEGGHPTELVSASKVFV